MCFDYTLKSPPSSDYQSRCSWESGCQHSSPDSSSYTSNQANLENNITALKVVWYHFFNHTLPFRWICAWKEKGRREALKPHRAILSFHFCGFKRALFCSGFCLASALGHVKRSNLPYHLTPLVLIRHLPRTWKECRRLCRSAHSTM